MHADGQPPHILAINDTPEILDLLHEVLEDEGYRVTTVATALPTPDEVAVLQPDLVILDYIWGNEDSGWSLLQRLRDTPDTQDLPIILCTGAARQLDPIRNQLPAMNVTLLLKPFDIDALVRTVAQLLGQDASGVPGAHPGA